MNTFVYQLHGGPFDGRRIIAGDFSWREEIPFEDPYAKHFRSKAIYGTLELPQMYTSPRLLFYWGSQPCGYKENPYVEFWI